MEWVESYEDNPDYWFDGRDYSKPVYKASEDLIIYHSIHGWYVIENLVTYDGDTDDSLEDAKLKAEKFT